MSILPLDLEIITPSTNNDWSTYHRISKNEIFRHIPNIVYDDNHNCFKNKAHHHFIAKFQEQIIGMIQLEKLQNNIWALRIIAVDKPMQNKQFGTNFIQFIKKYCIKHKAQKIRTHANNKAIEFYKKMGFVQEKWDDCSINENTTDMAYYL